MPPPGTPHPGTSPTGPEPGDGPRARTRARLAELTDRLATADDLSQYLHPGRQPTATQRTAIEWRHPTCSEPGCTMPAGLEIDHTTPWHQTHHTTIDDLNARCRPHHRTKTAAEATQRARRSPPLDN
jgi:hypothetical protein